MINNINLKSEYKRNEKEFLIDKVIFVNRCSKVVKGGRRFSFSALVVSGNKNGLVGIGIGKSKEVPEAIRKGTEKARKNSKYFNIINKTIPHLVLGKFKSTKILLLPSKKGSGIVAGNNVKSVLDAVGINDILTKTFGSKNKLSVIDATIKALSQLRKINQINNIRKNIL